MFLWPGLSSCCSVYEAMGLTTGAVARMIDRLEQAGYVRRTADPADRRRVVIEVVPERVATVESLLEFARDVRAAADARAVHETTNWRRSTTTSRGWPRPSPRPRRPASAPTRWSTRATRSGRCRVHRAAGRPHVGGSCSSAPARSRSSSARRGRRPDLYRARFEGAAPQVRVRDRQVIVQYRGMPFDWRKRTGTMALDPSSTPWPIEVVGGCGPRGGRPETSSTSTRFELTGGSEQVPARGRAGRTARVCKRHDGRHQDHPPRAPERRPRPA